MAYVPGFEHDIFVSYAHGDDREWINRLLDRLRPALTRLLGTEAQIWIDDEKLRRTRDFRKDIPESLKNSAVFLFFPSPTYIRSSYCIGEECRAFEASLGERRERFSLEEFANELFALRCPLLPVENNAHWELFPGLTDISFCDGSDTLPIDSPGFQAAFRRLRDELADVLRRMRNHSTPVFLYPADPGPDIREARDLLAAELMDRSFRVLPEYSLNLADQLRKASLSVFLIGKTGDSSARELADLATRHDKPWVVWCSPELEQGGDLRQLGFRRHLEQLESSRKTFLSASVSPTKLKEEVLALLRPESGSGSKRPGGKPRVYLIYNPRDRSDTANAGQIVFHYDDQIQFDLSSDDPSQHNVRLTQSDGVLLVWGSADEAWCASEFGQMAQNSRRAGEQALALFDPEETKRPAVQQIQQSSQKVYIAEEFGPRFQPDRLDPFFLRIRRGSGAPLQSMGFGNA